jgi:DNA adenine methylase
MRYQGGKSRIAAPIASILTAAGGDCFVSLFCGSCSVESKVTGYQRKILNDKHFYLIAMLRGVQSGYNLPEVITAEEYQRIKDNKDADPVLAGFAGFGCSFGGKWFGGYARNASGTNYAAQSKRSLLKDMNTLHEAEFICGDYRHLCIPRGAVIYADPPYSNTTGYSGERFNTAEFWTAMRLLSDTGHTVFVSEQEGPPDIECIWEKPFTRTLDRNKSNYFSVTEKLFYLPPRRFTPDKEDIKK